MANSIFNEHMSRYQARDTFFRAIDGKTKEQIKKIKSDYFETLKAISKREHKLMQERWIFH